MPETTALDVYAAFHELDAARQAYDAAAEQARESGDPSWDWSGHWYDDREAAEQQFCAALDGYVDARIAAAIAKAQT